MAIRDEKTKPKRLVRILDPRTAGSVGLARTLAVEARVSFGEESHGGEAPSFVIVCAEGSESLAEGAKRAKKIDPQAHVLIFGFREDLPLAHAALLAVPKATYTP